MSTRDPRSPSAAQVLKAHPNLKEVVSALEDAFPGRLPPTLVDPRELDALIGEQRVLEFLRRIIREVEGRVVTL
jgi:hypothetical protein